MCGRKRLDRAWSEASSVIEALGRSECGVGVEWGSPSSFKLTPSADRELSISYHLGPAGTLRSRRASLWSVFLPGSRRVGRGCGRRLAMGSGRVFARRASWGVRGLPRGFLSIYLHVRSRPLEVLPTYR